MAKQFDRVKFNTPTNGTGAASIGTRYGNAFYLPSEQGAADNDEIYYVLQKSNGDEETGQGTVNITAGTVSRDVVFASIVAGVKGTALIALDGTAFMAFVTPAEAFRSVRKIRTVTTTTDAIVNDDGGGVIVYNSASAIAVTLAQAGAATSFLKNWTTIVRNVGTANATITPTTSTIKSQAALVLKPGMSARITSDGTNYDADIHVELDASGNLTLTSGSLSLSGSISASAWGTNGIRYKTPVATLTDTSTAANATNTTGYTNVWGGDTIATQNVNITYTNYFSVYLKDPVAGTNATLTNKWALGVDSLKVTNAGATFGGGASSTIKLTSSNAGSGSGGTGIASFFGAVEFGRIDFALVNGTPGGEVANLDFYTITAGVRSKTMSLTGAGALSTVGGFTAGGALTGGLRGYIAGLILSNDATTPATILDIATGVATADDNSMMMVLASAITKNCNAAWAVGTGNGALDSGTTLAASTWYHCFLIERVDTGVVDFLLSTSATTPTMPTNYTKKRRIGSIKTDTSAHILGFTQSEEEFKWAVMPQDAVVTPADTLSHLIAVSAPPGVKCIANLAWLAVTPSGGVDGRGLVTSPDEPDTAAGPPFNVGLYNVSNGQASSDLWIRTNLSSQIRYRFFMLAGTTSFIYTRGYIDHRGRFA